MLFYNVVLEYVRFEKLNRTERLKRVKQITECKIGPARRTTSGYFAGQFLKAVYTTRVSVTEDDDEVHTTQRGAYQERPQDFG